MSARHPSNLEPQRHPRRRAHIRTPRRPRAASRPNRANLASAAVSVALGLHARRAPPRQLPLSLHSISARTLNTLLLGLMSAGTPAAQRTHTPASPPPRAATLADR